MRVPTGGLRQAHTGGRGQAIRKLRMSLNTAGTWQGTEETAGTWSRGQAGAAGQIAARFLARLMEGQQDSRQAGEPRNQQAGTQKAARTIALLVA